MLPSTLRSPTWSLPFKFSSQSFVCISHLSHAWYMTHPTHSPGFKHPDNIWWRVQIINPFLSTFLQPSVTFTLSDPNILLSTLFSSTLNLCSSHNIRDQVLHPYKATGESIVFYILISIILGRRWEEERFWNGWEQAFPEFNLFLFSAEVKNAWSCTSTPSVRLHGVVLS